MTPPHPDDIRAFRKAHRLTQRELAVRLGYSKRAVEHWEQGRRRAPVVLRLALEQVALGLAGGES